MARESVRCVPLHDHFFFGLSGKNKCWARERRARFFFFFLSFMAEKLLSFLVTLYTFFFYFLPQNSRSNSKSYLLEDLPTSARVPSSQHNIVCTCHFKIFFCVFWWKQFLASGARKLEHLGLPTLNAAWTKKLPATVVPG